MRKAVLLLLLSTLLIASCTTTRYEPLPSENKSFRVKSLIMHFTAVDYAQSVKYLVKKGHVSSHYLIPEGGDPSYPANDLRVYQLVDENERAWHAGVSFWQGRSGLNDTSIGIEIVNVPECTYRQHSLLKPQHGDERLCMFPDFDPQQIDLLIKLSKDILARHPDITPTAVVGHSDIAPSRKNDPGPRFPWYRLYKEGIGAWYEKEDLAYYWQKFSLEPVSIGLLQEALAIYGYSITQTGILDQHTTDVISAFQMHFLPWQVTGKNDESTAAAVFALIQKYFPEQLKALLIRHERELYQPKQTIIAKQGQVDRWFSAQSFDKGVSFTAYENSGAFRILASEPTDAKIAVNGELLNLTMPVATQFTEYNLSRRTKDGLNAITIDNISQPEASILLQVAYPKLTGTASDNQDNIGNIESVISSWLDASTNALTLHVVHKGKVLVHKAYGNIREMDDNIESVQKPASLNTQFPLNESTKAYGTALAVMTLIQQGKLDVSLPFNYYVPEFDGPNKSAITVAQLLSEQSGFRGTLSDYLIDEYSINEELVISSQQMREILLTQIPVSTEESEIPQHSDMNYMLLALLVERLSGMPIEQYLQNYVYAPLKLNNIGFSAKDNDFSLVFGHSGLYTDAKSIAVLNQLLLNRGGYGFEQLFASQILDEFVRPQPAASSKGLGWQLNNNDLGTSAFSSFASANTFGYIAQNNVILIDPALDLSIVLLTNKKLDDNQYKEIIDSVYLSILNRQ